MRAVRGGHWPPGGARRRRLPWVLRNPERDQAVPPTPLPARVRPVGPRLVWNGVTVVGRPGKVPSRGPAPQVHFAVTSGPWPSWRTAAPRRSRPAGLRSRRPRAGAARPLQSHPRAGPRPGPLHLSAPGSRFPCQNFLPRRGPSPTSFLPPPLRASPPASHSLRLPPLRSRAGDPRPVLRAALAVPTAGPRRDRIPSR